MLSGGCGLDTLPERSYPLMGHSNKHLRFGHSLLRDQRCLGIGDQLRSDNQCKELLPPPPPDGVWFPKLSRGGQTEEEQHVGGDPRSRGALRLTQQSWQGNLGKASVAGHPACPRTNEGESLLFYKATSLFLGSLVARSVASTGERLAPGYATCFQDSTPGVISPYSRQSTNGEMQVNPGAPASDSLDHTYSALKTRPP